MFKKIVYSGLAGLLLLSTHLNAQQTQQTQLNCTQTLRTARGIYDQGRLHELPSRLEGCLNKSEDNGGFTETERIEAYRILTLSYIYLEEPVQADSSLVNLLHTDPFFQLDEEVDPIEFKNLYNKFRTNPVFRVGLKIDFNTNHINVISNHYMWAASRGKGEYGSNIGIQFGLLFEKDLTERIVLNPELIYSTYTYNYTNNGILSDGGNLTCAIAQNRAQLNLLAQYELKKPKSIADKFIPFVALGPTFNYLVRSSFSGTTDVGVEVTGPPITTNENYKPLTLAITAVAGVKLKVSRFYIAGDVRFQYGLQNIVKEDNRFQWTPNNEGLQDYGYIDNDYSLSQSVLNVGIIVPRFNPKKLIR